MNPTTNGHAAAPATDEFTLVISWSPTTGQVKAVFPNLDTMSTLRMFALGLQAFAEWKAKTEQQRVTIPDMKVTGKLII